LGNNVGRLIQTRLDQNQMFQGWDLYFPTTAYEENGPMIQKLKTFIKYFETWTTQYTSNMEKVLHEKFVGVLYRLAFPFTEVYVIEDEKRLFGAGDVARLIG
jgi:hypothetical protein